MSGLVDTLAWLDRQLGSGDPSQSQPQQQPQSGGLLGDYGAPQGGIFGQVRPQLPTYEQFRQNYNPASWGKAFGSGLGAFIGKLAGGDDSQQAYNDMLAKAYGVETSRLNLAPYENQQQPQPQPQPGIPPSPAMARSPAGLFAGPDVQGQGVPGGDQGAPQVPSAAFGFAAPNGFAPPNGGGILDPLSVARRIQFLMQSPAGAEMATKWLPLLNDMNKQGTGFDAQGNQYRLGGANSADWQRELFQSLGKNEQGFGANGTISSLPGVIADAANKAGAVKGAEAWAQVNPEAVKAQDAARAKWLGPLEERQGSRTLFPQGLPGAPSQRIGGFTTGGSSSTALNGGGVLSYNSPETGKNATNLAEETADSRKAADGAYQQKAIFGGMLDGMKGATLGRYAENRTGWKNFLTTFVPGLDFSKDITQDQIFDKLSTQVAGSATNQLDQKAYAALQTMKSAFPNREMTDAALKEMIGRLSGVQDYVIAKDAARQNHIETTGSANGFIQGPWMRNNTPEKFIDASVKQAKGVDGGRFGPTPQAGAAVAAPIPRRPVSAPLAAPPVAAIKHLQMNPSLAAQFDAKYGAGAAARALGR